MMLSLTYQRYTAQKRNKGIGKGEKIKLKLWNSAQEAAGYLSPLLSLCVHGVDYLS